MTPSVAIPRISAKHAFAKPQANRYPFLQTLFQQSLDWNDLNLDFQLAALKTWNKAGADANRCFCQGA